MLMQDLFGLYEKLLDRYGWQKWWPVHKGNEILASLEMELNEKQVFEICAGVILAQNTSWINAEKAICNLLKAGALSLRAVNSISEKKLSSLIRPAGFFKQKAGYLKNFFRYVCKNNDSVVSFLGQENSREKLLQIKGIGRETADSMLLYAAKKPYFVVDAYTKRVFSRLGLVKENVSYEEMQDLFHQNLNRDAVLYGQYHALIVEFAKNLCRKKPLCRNCVFRQRCPSS